MLASDQLLRVSDVHLKKTSRWSEHVKLYLQEIKTKISPEILLCSCQVPTIININKIIYYLCVNATCLH